MPLKNYGVWVGYPISYKAETDDDTPHLQLYFDDSPSAQTGRYRAAINIKSSTATESRLVYWFVRNFANNPITSEISPFPPGFHVLPSNGLPALDYIRGNPFPLQSGTILRHNEPGENNDIIDFISPVLDEAIKRQATIYLFGEQFPNGIHDVHMNQGSSGGFARYNGIYQDGGILLHFPDDGHWEGVFLAFGVQKVHTDDKTGNPIGNVDFVGLLEGGLTPPPPGPGHEGGVRDGVVLIRAALLNPVGPDGEPVGEKETVHLLSKTKEDIDLDGWVLVNRNGQKQPLSGVLPGQASKGFAVPNSPLSNKGGTITLLDSNGLKIDGVGYSKEQAEREGDLVYFH